MQNNRSNLRRHIMFYLDIFDAGNREKIGWLGDLTESGVMIISQKDLPLAKPFIISIELPKNEPFRQRTMKVEIELRWSSPDKNPAYHLYGGIFTRIPSGSLKVIRALIHLFGFSDDQKITQFSGQASDFIDITYEEEEKKGER